MSGFGQFPANSYFRRKNKDEHVEALFKKGKNFRKSLQVRQKENQNSAVRGSTIKRITLSERKRGPFLNPLQQVNHDSKLCRRTLHYEETNGEENESEDTVPLPQLDLSTKDMNIPFCLRNKLTDSLEEDHGILMGPPTYPLSPNNNLRLKKSSRVKFALPSHIPVVSKTNVSRSTVKKGPRIQLPARRSVHTFSATVNTISINKSIPSITVTEASQESTDIKTIMDSTKLMEKCSSTMDVGTNTDQSVPLVYCPSEKFTLQLKSLCDKQKSVVSEVEDIFHQMEELQNRLRCLMNEKQSKINEEVKNLKANFEDQISIISHLENMALNDKRPNHSPSSTASFERIESIVSSVQRRKLISRSKSLPPRRKTIATVPAIPLSESSYHSENNLNSPFANLISRHRYGAFTPGTKRQVSSIRDNIQEQIKSLYD